MTVTDVAARTGKASILHGDFDLETGREDILAEWKSVTGSITRRHLHSGLEPFQETLALSAPGKNGQEWTVRGNGGGWEFSFSDGPVGRTVSFIEYLACGEVLRHGGNHALPIHAALLAPSTKGIIAIAGLARAGKSTASVALWEAGWDLYCDDRCFVFGHGTPRLEAIPIPRRISLRAPSIDLLTASTRESIFDSPFTTLAESATNPRESRCNFRPSAIRPEPRDPSFLLRAMVILDPGFSFGQVERLHPARAIRPLLACTAIHPGQALSKTVQPWLSIVNELPIFRLGRASLGEMTDRFFQIATELGLV